MMFVYKITERKLCMSLCKNHEVTLAAKDPASYTPCSRPHRKLLILSAYCDGYSTHIFTNLS